MTPLAFDTLEIDKVLYIPPPFLMILYNSILNQLMIFMRIDLHAISERIIFRDT